MNESTVQLKEAKPLPDGWRWVRLGEVCGDAEIRDPRAAPEVSFRYIDISGVDAITKRIFSVHTIIGKDAPSRARQVIKANDIWVATTRPNLNAVALVRSELDEQICSTGFCVLRPCSEIDPLFLFFFVQTDDFIRSISGEVRGMLYPAVTDSQVRAISIPLPSLSEQKRIAARAQELMKDIERARTACEARLEAAEALPQAYLRQVFESEEAQKWEGRRLGEVCEFSNGKFIRREDVKPQGTYPVYGANGPIGYTDKYLIDEPVMIIGRVGSCGEINKSSGSAWITDNTIILAPLNNLDFDFLYFTLKTLNFEEIRAASVQPLITQGDLKAAQIPLPSLPEQKRIASELQAKIEEAERLKRSIQKQLEAINALPQAILRKAFSGEL